MVQFSQGDGNYIGIHQNHFAIFFSPEVNGRYKTQVTGHECRSRLYPLITKISTFPLS